MKFNYFGWRSLAKNINEEVPTQPNKAARISGYHVTKQILHITSTKMYLGGNTIC